MKIAVCPRCGSKNIFAGKMSSGILYGISSWTQECRNCGFKGSPIEFDSYQEYENFLQKINAEAKVKEQALKESKQEKTSQKKNFDSKIENEYSFSASALSDHWHDRHWWLEIIIALVLALFISLYEVIKNFSLFGFEVGILYTVLEFIIFFIFVLIGIIIIEYILHTLRKMLDQSS